MANRSYLYTTNDLPGTIEWEGNPDLRSVGEWNWDIPDSFRVLLSGSPVAVRSSMSAVPDPIAIAGDAATGVTRLMEYLDRLPPEADQLVADARAFFAHRDNVRTYFVLECAELFDSWDEDLVEANSELLSECARIGDNWASGRAHLTEDPETFGLGCWSHYTYFQLSQPDDDEAEELVVGRRDEVRSASDRLQEAMDDADPLAAAEAMAEVRAELESATPAERAALGLLLARALYWFDREGESLRVVADVLADPEVGLLDRARVLLFRGRVLSGADDTVLADAGEPHHPAMGVEQAREALRLVDEATQDPERLDEAVELGVGAWRLLRLIDGGEQWVREFIAWLETRLPRCSPTRQAHALWVALEAAGEAAQPQKLRLQQFVAAWPRTPETAEVISAAQLILLQGTLAQGQRTQALDGLLRLADKALATGDDKVADYGMQALLRLAQTHIDLGQHNEAEQVFRRAAREWGAERSTDMRQASSQAWYWWTRTVGERGDERAAERLQDDHLAATSHDADGLTRSWAARSLLTTSRRQHDLRHIDRLLDVWGDDDAPDVVQQLIDALHLRAGQRADESPQQAMADYQRVLELAELDEQFDNDADLARNNLNVLSIRAGDYRSRDEIYGVASEELRLGDEADSRNDPRAMAHYERAFELTASSPDAETRLVGIAALRQLVQHLSEAKDYPAVLSVGSRLLAVGDGSPDHRVRESLIASLATMGLAAHHLGDKATALRAYDDALARWGGDRQPSLLDPASLAAYNRALALDDRSAPAAAADAYELVTEFLGSSPSLVIQRRVAKALFNKALVVRDELGRPDLAMVEFKRLVRLFEAVPDDELQRLVGRARGELPQPRKSWWRR